MLMRFEQLRDYDRNCGDPRTGTRARQIPVDAYRRGDEFKVYLDLPGADPGSIELTVEKDLLSVRATRTWHRVDGDEVQVQERAQGELGRELFLGESLDRDHITAIYHDGVLMITIPVTEQSKPHKVDVVHVGSVAEALDTASPVSAVL